MNRVAHPALPALLAAAALALPSAGCWHNANLDTSPTFRAQRAAKSAPMMKLRWRLRVHEAEDWDYKNKEYATPALLPSRDELVVATSGGHVLRVQASSGKVRWRVPLLDAAKVSEKQTDVIEPVHADPLVHDQSIYVGTLHGTIHALDYATGKTRWTFRAEDAIESKLALSDGRLFFMDGREILYALDAATGKLLWRYQRRAPEYFTIKGAGVPVVEAGVVYCGFADGSLVALQLESGELLWSRDISADRAEFTDVDLPAIVDGNRLYAASYSGGLYALDMQDGLVQWRVPIDGIAAMIRHRRLLYVASSQGRVQAIDPYRRKILWSFRFKKTTPVALRAHGSHLYVSTSGGRIAVLDRKRGALVDRWDTFNGFNTTPLFNRKRGFALSNGGYLYGFTLHSKKPVARKKGKADAPRLPVK